jgi:hypothetical protein
MDAFLQKEGEKWHCPGCGGTISCHNGICFDCGIERLKERAVKRQGCTAGKMNGGKAEERAPPFLV